MPEIWHCPLTVCLSGASRVTLDDDRVSSYINALKNIPRETQLLMTIFPNNRKDRYDSLKKVACVDMGRKWRPSSLPKRPAGHSLSRSSRRPQFTRR